MQKDYLERMKSEETELSSKLEKIEKFFHTEIYEGLSKQKQNLLCAQYGAMIAYQRILFERIRVENEITPAS